MQPRAGGGRPIDDRSIRTARPYSDDSHYSGVVIESSRISIKMFHLEPDPGPIGSDVRQGGPMGTAQDIATRYGEEMIPHIHLKVGRVDPEVLMEGGNMAFDYQIW